MKNKSLLILPFIFLVFSSALFSQTSASEEIQTIKVIDSKRLPEIPELKSKDPVYREYSYIVEDNYKLVAAGKTPDMMFFKTTVPAGMNLLSLAARCCISYDTIATLNGLENAGTTIENTTLILPVVRGLFIKVSNCKSSLEVLLHQKYINEILTKRYICYKIDGEDFIFLQNKELSPTERAYFVDIALRLPLDRETFWISSDFGKRISPISGEWKDHKGIDLAAAEGTPVYAIKDGIAAYCINNDSTFGNYIILSHDKGVMTSIYAHLSKIAVSKNSNVKKGDVIGYVGSTGLATGSHLHFEIRQGGIPQDPQKKLRLN